MKRLALCAIAVLLVLAHGLARAQEPPSASAARAAHADRVPEAPGVDARLVEIGRRIQAVAVYPPIARERGVEGEVRVAFQIDSRGQAIRIETLETSGSVSLDLAAEHAVTDAGRLPLVYGRITVPVRFRLAANDPVW